MRCYPRSSSKSQNKSNKNKILTDIPEGDINKKDSVITYLPKGVYVSARGDVLLDGM